MKTLTSALVLAFAVALPARAELFRPETVTGAILGGVAGAVIGHNDDRHGWEGAAYGAAAGALIGTLVGESRHEAEWRAGPAPVYRGVRYPGRHDRRPMWRPPYVYRRPAVVYVPPRRPAVYVYRRPDYVRRGVLLGGIVGAVIGHNDDRHGWEGAAYGVGAGYVLGSIAQRQADRLARETDALAALRASATPAPAAAPQQVTIINNNYYGPVTTSPMSGANSLFGR